MVYIPVDIVVLLALLTDSCKSRSKIEGVVAAVVATVGLESSLRSKLVSSCDVVVVAVVVVLRSN